MSGASTTTDTKHGTDLAAVARGAWDTRPTRRRDDAKVAGVAAAIARRYDLDPTLVRVAFVVWTIVGGGVLLYLVGWLVLPPDPVDPPRRDRAVGRRGAGPPPIVVVATVVAAFATLGPAVGGRVVTVVALALAAVTLYLLHTSRGALGVPGSPGTPGTATPLDPAVALGPPVAWDALGAAPAAWAFPTAAAAPIVVDPGPRRRGVLTPVTLALALLAAGLAGGALLLGVPGVTGVWVPAAALAVVGTGLLVGSVSRPPRSRRGLVVVAVPLLIATVFGSVALTRGVDDGFAGDQRAVDDVTTTPATAAQVLPGYRTGLGDLTLDLSRTTPGAPIRTTVESGVGDVTVTVPATADVTLTCQSGIGDVDCLGRTGTSSPVVDLGPDGPGGQVVDLTARSGAGDLVVRRG